jgi:mRNA interferase MazF
VTDAGYAPDSGNPIWIDFDPTGGREQSRRRPALVVSPAAFTENSGVAVVCPITSRMRPIPTSVMLPAGMPTAGEILTSHIRAIGTYARPVRYAGAAVNAEITQPARAELSTFIMIYRRPRMPRMPRG